MGYLGFRNRDIPSTQKSGTMLTQEVVERFITQKGQEVGLKVTTTIMEFLIEKFQTEEGMGLTKTSQLHDLGRFIARLSKKAQKQEFVKELKAWESDRVEAKASVPIDQKSEMENVNQNKYVKKQSMQIPSYNSKKKYGSPFGAARNDRKKNSKRRHFTGSIWTVRKR